MDKLKKSIYNFYLYIRDRDDGEKILNIDFDYQKLDIDDGEEKIRIFFESDDN